MNKIIIQSSLNELMAFLALLFKRKKGNKNGSMNFREPGGLN